MEGLGEFQTVMRTRDEVEGLHNCREFSQPLPCLYEAMQSEEKSFLLLSSNISQNLLDKWREMLFINFLIQKYFLNTRSRQSSFLLKVTRTCWIWQSREDGWEVESLIVNHSTSRQGWVYYSKVREHSTHHSGLLSGTFFQVLMVIFEHFTAKARQPIRSL